MAKEFLLSREVKIAICNALGVDQERCNVIDVDVSLKNNEIATVSVKFVMTRSIIKLISDDLNAETQS